MTNRYKTQALRQNAQGRYASEFPGKRFPNDALGRAAREAFIKWRDSLPAKERASINSTSDRRTETAAPRPSQRRDKFSKSLRAVLDDLDRAPARNAD